MSRTPLIPPHEAPPASWQRGDDKFNWGLGILGAVAGVIVGSIALLLNASPWWWLAVVVGLGLGSVTSKSFKVPVLWGRK